jgi:hypothetical protein
MQVLVTRVTVEYEAGGKRFTVVLDPTKVDAILLSKTDVDRLKFAQQEARKKDPAVPEVIEHRLNPLEQVPAKDPKSGRPTFIMTGTTSSDSPVGAERSLWWHTSQCAYFHPE